MARMKALIGGVGLSYCARGGYAVIYYTYKNSNRIRSQLCDS